MNLKNFPKRLDSKTSCLRIAVPENLDLALEGLIRKVLREQPKTDDIYSFAADYFETLLKIRDKTGAKFTSNQLCPFHNDENAHEMIKLATSFSKPSAKIKEAPPLSKNKTSGKKKETEAKENQRKLKLKDAEKTEKSTKKERPDLLRKIPGTSDKIPEVRSEIKNKEEFLTSDPIKELVEKEMMETDLLNKNEETAEKTSGLVPESDTIQLTKHETTENEREKLLQNREGITKNQKMKTVEERNRKDKKIIDVGKTENSVAENKSTSKENKDSLQESAKETNKESNENREIKEEIRDEEKPEISEVENKSTAEENKDSIRISSEETNRENIRTTEIKEIANMEAENKTLAEEEKLSNHKREIKDEITDEGKPENVKAENKTITEENKDSVQLSAEETNRENSKTTEMKEIANTGGENKTAAEEENKLSNHKREIKKEIIDEGKPENTEAENKIITKENKDSERITAEETNKESYEETNIEKERKTATEENGEDTYKENSTKTEIKEEVTDEGKPENVEPGNKTITEENKDSVRISAEETNKESYEKTNTEKERKTATEENGENTYKENSTKTEIKEEITDEGKPENVEAENKAIVEENKNTLQKSPEEANKENNERTEIKEKILDTEKLENVNAENKTTAEETIEDKSKKLEETSEHKTKNLEEANESIQDAEANTLDKTKLSDKEVKDQKVPTKTTTGIINEVPTTTEDDKKTQIQPDEKIIKETAEQPEAGETQTEIKTKTLKATADVTETEIVSDQQQKALQAAENTGDPTEPVTADESKNSKSKLETVPVKEENLLSDDTNYDTRNAQSTEGIAARANAEAILHPEEPNEFGNSKQAENNLTDLTVKKLNDVTEDVVEEGEKSNDLNNNLENQAVTQQMHVPVAGSSERNGESVPEVKPTQEQEEEESLTKPKKQSDTTEDITEELCTVVDTQHMQNTNMQQSNLEGTQNTEDKAGQSHSVFDSQIITNTKSDLQPEDKITQEELCTVTDIQHIPKEVQNHKDDKPEEQQVPTDAQSTTGSSSLQTAEAIESPHIAIEEVEKEKEKPQSQGEVQVKTIQTYYYDTLQVPEVVTKEFRLHSVATEAMNTFPNVPVSVDETKRESAEPPISLSPPTDENHPEDLKNTSPSVDASSLQESTDDLLMTPTSGYSLNLSELSWQTVTGLFLDSEKRYNSLGKPTEDKQEVNEVFHKTVIVSNIKAVPVPPRDADHLNEESNLQIATDKEEEKPENESLDGSSNNERSSDSDIPFMSVEVKTIIETQILDDEDEKKDENDEEREQPDVEVKVEATIDIIDQPPEIVKKEMPHGENQEKNDPKPGLEEIQDKSQHEERRESSSTEQTTAREGSSGESDLTLSSAPTEIRTDSGKRNLSSTRSLLSTQSLDYGKRNPLLKTRSLSTFRHGVTDFEVWTAIEKELEEAATKIQSKYRGYKTRKKLQRENAVEKTTEESSTSTTPVEAEDKDERQQSTGEFHDSIVLSEYPR